MRRIHQVSTILWVSLFTVHISSAPSPVMENCIKINACSCLTDSGLVIDLSPLDSMNYLQPAFKDVAVIGNSTDKFSWNPCTPFCEDHCENAAVCRVADTDAGLYYDTGKHKNAQFSLNYTDGELNLAGLVLIYEDDEGDVPRTSILHLLCDEKSLKDELKPYGETALHSAHYFFEVVSKYACPRNVSVSSVVQLSPAQPTCPRSWVSTTAAPEHPTSTPDSTTSTTPTEPTTTSTPIITQTTTTDTEAPSTDSAATPTMTTPAPVSLTAIYVVLSIAVVVLVAETVFVIILTVNLVRGRTGTMLLPGHRCGTCCKTEPEDRQGII